MGLIGGIVKRLIKLILYLAVVVAFIVLIPNLPPYTKFTRIELEPTQPRVGALAPNDDLNNAQALYKDKLLGPEAFQIWNGEIYTGLATGEIVKISPGGHVTFVTKIGQPCSGIIQEHICGRPLGFVIDEKNKLMYVADAYHGIWKVDLVSDKKQLLVSPRVPIDGRVPKIFNSVALDKNGDLYWTTSSSDFDLRDGVMASLVDPSGRLFYYNSAKNISKVLLDDVWFANGVVISPDNQFVLVAESSRYRILKYYIDGPKKGTSEVFVAGLPGVPDVLRPLPDGSGVLASLYIVFDDEHPLLSKTMSSAPLARKFIARLLRLIEIPFEFLQSQFPNYIFENIVYQIGHFGSIASLTPGKTGIVQIDWNGNIVASYYNTDGSLLHISDVIVFNNKLYTGCPHLQNYIGAVPAPPQLIKAFTVKKGSAKEQPTIESKSPQSNKPKAEEKKEVPKSAKPTTQTTPPTTTTPKPTTKPTTKPNDIPKEKVVKQTTAPKESERAKVKEEKPKAIPKQGDEKPVQKDAEVKPKVASKDTEAKPKVVQKEIDPKMKATAQNSAQPKPTNKNQEKPVKETESKVKVAKTDSVKSEVNKEKAKHSQTGADQPRVKTATKTPEPKSEQQNTKTKPASDTKPTKTDAKESAKATPEPKVIPVKENIPSDTAKPKRETLKVIKKTGPQEIPNPNNL